VCAKQPGFSFVGNLEASQTESAITCHHGAVKENPARGELLLAISAVLFHRAFSSAVMSNGKLGLGGISLK
jgi:hypothetical protein